MYVVGNYKTPETKGEGKVKRVVNLKRLLNVTFTDLSRKSHFIFSKKNMKR